MKTSLVFDIKDPNFIVYDGKRYFSSCSDADFYGMDLSRGLCAVIVADGKIIAKGFSGDEEFSFTQPDAEDFLNYAVGAGSQSTGKVVYDDFKIADENYYAKNYKGGNMYEKHNDFNHDETEKFVCTKQKEEETEHEACRDEIGLRGGAGGTAQKFCKSGRGKEYDKESVCVNSACRYVATTDENDNLTDECFTEEYFFDKIVLTRPRFYGAEKMLPESRFYVMDGEDGSSKNEGESGKNVKAVPENNKIYYFGAIYLHGDIAYYAYLVPAKRKNPPKGFSDGLFLPSSFFNDEDGFYCLFQKPRGR